MKKLLSLTILFISHGLFGMNSHIRTKVTTDNGTIERVESPDYTGFTFSGFTYDYNEKTTYIDPPEGFSTEGLLEVSIGGSAKTFYKFSNDPEKETFVTVSGKELRTTHAQVSLITASKTDINGKIQYSASEVSHGTIKNWGGTNKKTEPVAQERFKLLKSIFEKTGNTRDLGPKSNDLFQLEQLSFE